MQQRTTACAAQGHQATTKPPNPQHCNPRNHPQFCACVNVYTTPIPFAYISHLRTFLVLWLACVPWVYVAHYGYITIVLVAVIGYGIIGGLAAAAGGRG